MNNKSDFLETTSIPKLLLKMSAPAIIGMTVMTLYNIVDSIFIGHKVGAIGLGAIGIVFPFMMIVIALSVGIGIGASSIISRKLGEKDFKFAEKVFETFVTFLLVISIISTVLGIIFIDQLLFLLGASPTMLPYAKAYLIPILYGLVFQIISPSLTNIVRSVGSAKTAMFAMLIGAILNVLLDYIFLFVLDYNMEGAAYATVISQIITTIFLITYFLSSKTPLKFQRFIIDPKVLKMTMIIGLPSFIRQSSMSFIGILVNHTLQVYGGDLAIAAYGIMFRILMLIILPTMGIMQGSQPIIGYNFGAKKFDRVKEVFYLSIKASSIVILATFIIVYIFPEIFVKMFTKDPQLIDFTLQGLLIMLLGIPLIGFQFMAQGYFQAIGKAKEALILSLLRQVVFFIPFLIIFPMIFGLKGVWIIYPVSDLFSSIITYFMIRKEFSSL